jgi:superfamily II DNA/RNA helicase
LKFDEFGLHPEILSGLRDMGFESATPVQEMAIPIILEGHDLIACAQTGTGKTAAFLIPTIDILDDIPGKHIKCLILCPTRELAVQIDRECEGLCYHTYVSSAAVYGGNKGADDFNRQKAAFTSGSDIVVATPGRLLQHISLGYVDFSGVEFLILDEADRMLDMGFVADIQRIISFLPEKRQNLLFSATMPNSIRSFAAEILKNPKSITLKVSKPAEGINQSAYCVFDDQKIALVSNLMKARKIESVIIFASRKNSVDRIVRALGREGLDARGMHSDRDQTEREEIINDFKNKKFPVLVATDILSRGIDIDGLSHVINYDVPPDPEDYVHRIGRTARADATGEAITFINEDDMQRFGSIERLIERELEKTPLPEGFGEGPEYAPFRKRRSGGNFSRGGGKGKGGGYGRNSGGDRKKSSGPSKGNKRGGNKPQNGAPRNQEAGKSPNKGPRPQNQNTENAASAEKKAQPKSGPKPQNAQETGSNPNPAPRKKRSIPWKKKPEGGPKADQSGNNNPA